RRRAHRCCLCLRVHGPTEDISLPQMLVGPLWMRGFTSGLLVELVGGPRRIRELLVQRLPVADAAPQELGPGGDGDPRIERFRHPPPQVRMVPAELVSAAVA